MHSPHQPPRIGTTKHLPDSQPQPEASPHSVLFGAPSIGSMHAGAPVVTEVSLVVVASVIPSVPLPPVSGPVVPGIDGSLVVGISSIVVLPPPPLDEDPSVVSSTLRSPQAIRAREPIHRETSL